MNHENTENYHPTKSNSLYGTNHNCTVTSSKEVTRPLFYPILV